MTTVWLAVLMTIACAGSLLAHHSLNNFDTTKAVRVKGTVIKVHQINPHSFIYLEQTDATGKVQRWAVEGPTLLQLNRRGVASDFLKYGDVIEACGYLPKEPIVWQIAEPGNTTAPSLAGKLLNGELIVMPDGKEMSWGDYGVHKCFAPGHADQHSK
ncbi:MAG TPA: DUF6152 family protein [Vicinamibacterales bacterium]|nr:DUF6152 family protein [Vicinamibacterales bacterium]